ncbi:MAG: phospholipid transport system substrate-binding protein [Halioglobus sp.]|jgi:phospholipid transport system substrate-binding protein
MSYKSQSIPIMLLSALAGMFFALQVVAQSDPYTLVGDTTTRVMSVVSTAEDYVDEDPERYYSQVQEILDPLIDYRGFARKVMGPYASSKRYRSLDEAGRQQLKDQLDEFTQIMRLGLVRTYSKGLLAFGDARIEVETPESIDVVDRISVRQSIYTDNPQPYIVLYQMGQSKTGDWQLRNVIIESVNLGEIYLDQFLASARVHDGNLNAVIKNWTAVTVDVES